MCETTRESEKTAMGNAEAHRRLGEREREGRVSAHSYMRHSKTLCKRRKKNPDCERVL